ncbi:hypothetical protein B0H14DRAFT_2614803 [Mycena olivaceomarginata]|nr:hypothetical protein B0H14DRAFT_2614803 [Mycena olivaceomarginata]
MLCPADGYSLCKALSPPLPFLSHPSSTPVCEAEQQLSNHLDGLEECQVLQHVTHMPITALVHPKNKQDSEQAMVEDIFDAVMASHIAQSMSDTAGGDVDPITCPTHCEALDAAMTLQSFMATLGDTYTHYFQASDTAQSNKCHGYYTTSITDFFARTE